MTSKKDYELLSFRRGSVGYFVNEWRDGLIAWVSFDVLSSAQGYRMYCEWFKTCPYKPHRASFYEYRLVVLRVAC